MPGRATENPKGIGLQPNGQQSREVFVSETSMDMFFSLVKLITRNAQKI